MSSPLKRSPIWSQWHLRPCVLATHPDSPAPRWLPLAPWMSRHTLTLGLFTCSSLCLEYSSPMSLHSLLPHLLQVFVHTLLSDGFPGHSISNCNLFLPSDNVLSPCLLYFSLWHLSPSHLLFLKTYFVHDLSSPLECRPMRAETFVCFFFFLTVVISQCQGLAHHRLLVNCYRLQNKR